MVHNSSTRQTVVTAAQNVAALAKGNTYLWVADVDHYIRYDGTAAAEASGSHFVPAGMPVLIDAGDAEDTKNLSVLKKTGMADGVGTLSKVQFAR
jgi:ligand-binding sensor domain-containing protein